MPRPKGILTFLQSNPPELNSQTGKLEYRIPAQQLLDAIKFPAATERKERVVKIKKEKKAA
jgi:hypothetical protein